MSAELVYECYPRKVGKPDALKAITRAIAKHGADFVLEKTKAYALARAGQDPSFTPHPATWFNQERYNDDPATWVRWGYSAGAARRANERATSHNNGVLKAKQLEIPIARRPQ